jgi:hypothetical protein
MWEENSSDDLRAHNRVRSKERRGFAWNARKEVIGRYKEGQNGRI